MSTSAPIDKKASVPSPEEGGRVRRRRFRLRAFSGLTQQIVALNIIALAFLGGGILYFNQFRTGLIETRLDALQSQAELMAAALGEAATSGPAATTVDIEEARPIMRRLTQDQQGRARLFLLDGELALDSRSLIPTAQVSMEALPPPPAEGEDQRGFQDVWSGFRNWILEQVSPATSYPPYEERFDQTATDYPEVVAAFDGTPATGVRQLEDGTLVLSVAVPVQRFYRVLGTLMVSLETTEIEQVVQQERLAILEVFAVAVLVTVFLSLFLAGTIARPVRRLAEFAHKVRQGRGREETIPDFSRRHDEVGELSQALRDMTQALYARIDAIEAFAADVAHEFKNPLTSLRSAVETMEKANSEDQRRQLLEIIQNDVHRLDRLISDISNASRLDAELLRAEMEPVSLGELLQHILDAYSAMETQDLPMLQLNLPQNQPLYVRGIESHLGQVFSNLIDNAISFSPPGGTIRIEAAKESGDIVVRVEDEGPGIPEHKLEQIFERFYSERPEENRFGDHSGLGLNICQQIIEVHDGHIRAVNLTDAQGNPVGASFEVRLPAGHGPDGG